MVQAATLRIEFGGRFGLVLRRASAALIDLFALLTATLVLSLAATIPLQMSGANATDWGWIGQPIFLGLALVYFTAYEGGARTSFGKGALGLEVRTLSGGLVPIGSRVLRCLFKLALPVALISPSARALDDYIAGTVVRRCEA